MKQRTTITSPSGHKIKMEQEQREFALSRDEVIFLTQIPTVYLLDELVSRVGSELLWEDLPAIMIERVMLKYNGNQVKTARSLGITPRMVYYWITERHKRKLLEERHNSMEGG